jgi:hypothetical protein
MSNDTIQQGDLTSQAIDKAGAFFAFNEDQFQEKRKVGVDYTNLGNGLICPQSSSSQLFEDLKVARQAVIDQDLKSLGVEGVVKRELHNHEAFYTGHIGDTVDALHGYGIDRATIHRIFDEESKRDLDDTE